MTTLSAPHTVFNCGQFKSAISGVLYYLDELRGGAKAYEAAVLPAPFTVSVISVGSQEEALSRFPGRQQLPFVRVASLEN